MATFWDTSAVLPLVYREVHTPAARTAAERAGPYLAWEWLRVEARLAVNRRGEDEERVARLEEWFAGVLWERFGAEELGDVIDLGRRHSLRAADAGHLYTLLRMRRLFPDVVLVCFDDDLSQAARKEGVKVLGK